MFRTALCGLAVLALTMSFAPVQAEEAERPLDFELKDPSGTTWHLADQRGKWVVLEWVNYDCPFVKKQYDPGHRAMQALQKRLGDQGVVWFSICSSAEGKQGYMTPKQAAERMKIEQAVPTALLLDPTGEVGHRFGAKTTPDMRIICPEGKVVYAGAIDSIRSRDAADVAKATNYVSYFFDSVQAGKGYPFAAHPPYGCSVKYADREATAAANAAPAFRLTDATGTQRSLADYKGKWVVLEWVNYDCPFVKKQYDASHKAMQALQQAYAAKGVVWLSICSSAPGNQGYMSQADALRRLGEQGAHPTALLLDPTGEVGHAYGAKTTPDMRVIDPQGRIVYAGAIDSIRSMNPGDVAGATNHVVAVLDAVLAGKPAPYASQPPYGCSVKYAK
ncbi:MAG: redoxin domain-containing protein [Planctomycetota bacterium]